MDEYINIGRWFSVLHRRSQIFVVEACEKLHLTYSEYVMLLRIYDHEGARQDELAAMLYLDKAVVTRTMTMLENKGLVYREQDARDKRAKHVYLTDYGKKQHAYLRNVIQRWSTTSWRTWSPRKSRSSSRASTISSTGPAAPTSASWRAIYRR